VRSLERVPRIKRPPFTQRASQPAAAHPDIDDDTATVLLTLKTVPYLDNKRRRREREQISNQWKGERGRGGVGPRVAASNLEAIK
jgi:hypothetical protein